MQHGRHRTDDGLVTAAVGPTTVPDLAAALDPAAPWVLVSAVGPLLGPGWTRAAVPTAAADALRPPGPHGPPAGVRAAGRDRGVPRPGCLLAGHGVRAHQLTRRPDDRVDLSGAVPRARYLAFGLVVGVDLPHAHGTAQLVTTDDEAMGAALRRLSGSRR
jgi:hypothetical protein